MNDDYYQLYLNLISFSWIRRAGAHSHSHTQKSHGKQRNSYINTTRHTTPHQQHHCFFYLAFHSRKKIIIIWFGRHWTSYSFAFEQRPIFAENKKYRERTLPDSNHQICVQLCMLLISNHSAIIITQHSVVPKRCLLVLRVITRRGECLLVPTRRRWFWMNMPREGFACRNVREIRFS